MGSALTLHAGLALFPTSIHAAPARTLRFPRDAGAHPDFKTEWWYLTGWVAGDDAASAAPYGFQITFFRSRVEGTQGMQSRLAARQLVFAHAAITDVKARRLWHDQRIARWSGDAPGSNPTDTASASTQDTGVQLGSWSLLRAGADLQARLQADGFGMDLRFATSQNVLLQGQQGLSRKGPEPQQTSYYYSLPQLRVTGSLTLQGKTIPVANGTAWLDHEWSDEILPAGALGWDWLGINLFDGSALTAFQLRDKTGAALWDGGSFRAGPGSGSGLYTFSRGEVIFKPLRSWRSPQSGASYPVEWMVRTPADFYTVRALVDNQELDSRQSTGAIYWEGLCEVWDSNQHVVGRGYLEMTGYAAPLAL
jgi:predicted secreted hydrolase